MQRRDSSGDYVTSLAFLSRQVILYYRKPAVILIDEYDVPLKALIFAVSTDRWSILSVPCLNLH